MSTMIDVLNSNLWLTLIFVALLGLVVGSFLNVVIYRYPIILKREWKQECHEFLNLPAEENVEPFNLIKPRSRCPQCHAPIKAWHNIPVLTYLILGGKCANCKKSISPIYPFVEILCAALTVLVFWHFGLTEKAVVATMFTWGLIVLSFIDINEQILPDTIVYILLWLGLLSSVFFMFANPNQAILGAIMGYLLLWAIAHVFKFIRKVDGMGHGDFKMLAMLGAWMGVYNILNIVIFATIAALIVGSIMMLNKKLTRQQPLSFGPFLAIGGWVTLMYGPSLLALIQKAVR